MFYRVTGSLKADTAASLHAKLTDGTIANQPPEGSELTEAMNRAVVTEDGRVRWSMVCYCKTPLAHERKAVLDEHFADLEVERIEDYEDFAGPAFMEHLARQVDQRDGRGGA